jgi:uncharacterized protein YodC (DUF2158 family)
MAPPSETAPAFQLEDKVVLKSGGPTMTVIGFSRNGRVWCEYHDRPGRLCEDSFIPEALERAG